MSYSPRESTILTLPSAPETGSSRSEISPSTMSSRAMEVIKTPSVAGEQEHVEMETYAGNTITLGAKLLQNIFLGSWAKQQLYGLTPDWYRDSFYNIVQPLERQIEDYEISKRPQPPLTKGYHPRLLPIGPPSDISSIDRPPSTVGPLVSVYESATPKRK